MITRSELIVSKNNRVLALDNHTIVFQEVIRGIDKKGVNKASFLMLNDKVFCGNTSVPLKEFIFYFRECGFLTDVENNKITILW